MKHRDFLPIHILEEFPELQALFDEVEKEYTSNGQPESIPRRFAGRVCDLYLNRYQDTRNLSDLAPFIAFVNREYEQHQDFRPALSTSFIDRLPDPQIDTKLARLLSPKVRAQLDERWDWRQEPGRQQLVLRIGEAFPQFQIHAHTNSFGREKDVLATDFLIDVTAHCVNNIIDGSPERIQETKDVIDHLETEYGNNDDLDHLIAEYFLDTFPHPNNPGHDITKLLTPKLQAAYRTQRQLPDDEEI